jgi:hypothetical protein
MAGRVGPKQHWQQAHISLWTATRKPGRAEHVWLAPAQRLSGETHQPFREEAHF